MSLVMCRVFLSFSVFFLLAVDGIHEDQPVRPYRHCIDANVDQSVFDYSLFDIEDEKKEKKISLNKYRGKTLLIVNTATYCGYTYQYPFFNELKNHYSEEQFEILAFPCNQFGLVRRENDH
jgi:hypothetical protein